MSPQIHCHLMPTAVPAHHHPRQEATKLKLKFSVDRILGRDTDSSRRNSQDSGFHQSPSSAVRENCADCSESSSSGERRDAHESAAALSPSGMYAAPYSVAAMLGFGSSAAASVVRPLAMRYLQRSPPIVGELGFNCLTS